MERVPGKEHGVPRQESLGGSAQGLKIQAPEQRATLSLYQTALGLPHLPETPNTPYFTVLPLHSAWILVPFYFWELAIKELPTK